MDAETKSVYHVGMETYGTVRVRILRFVLTAVIGAGVAASLMALDVAEEELRRTEDSDIEFINFEGPVESPQTVAQIVGIGEYLAREGSYFGRYRILSAVDESVTSGLDADILYILPEARVNHIDNVRAILSGYLEARYGYSSANAMLLARLSTIYNAVNRGDPDFFEERYKPVVVENLSAENVGISLRYTDWPGNTEIVVPLRSDRLVVDPFALADEGVIDDLRRREDMGLEDRRELVELMDEVIIQESEEITEEQERIAGELEDLEERERELLEQEERTREEREALEDAPEEERADREQAVEEEERRIEEEREALDEDRAALDEEQETVDERDEELEELEDQAQAVRDDIAEDQEEVMEDEELSDSEDPDEETGDPEEEAADVRTLTGLQVQSESDGLSRSRIVRLNADSGEVVETGAVNNVLSRSLVPFGPENEYLVLTEDT
ncbi:MAG: P83/100 family protein, partial [Spirochaetota bacterium]